MDGRKTVVLQAAYKNMFVMSVMEKTTAVTWTVSLYVTEIKVTIHTFWL